VPSDAIVVNYGDADGWNMIEHALGERYARRPAR
jgi:hypothetical protein